MDSIVGRLYIENDERDTLVEVESTDHEDVDLHIGPRTPQAITVTVSVEEAWRLSWQLARAASGIEINRKARP